jgi:hypothetical protein
MTQTVVVVASARSMWASGSLRSRARGGKARRARARVNDGTHAAHLGDLGADQGLLLVHAHGERADAHALRGGVAHRARRDRWTRVFNGAFGESADDAGLGPGLERETAV